MPWLEFIDYFNLQETSEGVFYDPKIDDKSPLFWNIKDAQKFDDGFHNIIGFLSNDNPIMEDVLAQLNMLIQEQQQLSDYIDQSFLSMPDLHSKDYILESLGEKFNLQDKTLYSRITQKIRPPLLKDCELREFGSREEIFDFVRREDLDQRLLFGF